VKSGPTAESLVLCYHAVSPNWPSILAITPERLREQLDFLVRHGFQGATFSQIVTGEAPMKALAITFDDAFHSVLDHAFQCSASSASGHGVRTDGSGRPAHTDELARIDKWMEARTRTSSAPSAGPSPRATS
jgi:hypothetical protein